MLAMIRTEMLAQTGSMVRIQAYSISGRGVTYADRRTWLGELAYWEARVEAEKRSSAFGPTVLPRMVPIS